MPPDVLCERPCTEDADAIVATPEGGVCDDDGRMRLDILFGDRDRIELFAHPDMRVVVLLCELLKSLLAFDVFIPKLDRVVVVSP